MKKLNIRISYLLLLAAFSSLYMGGCSEESPVTPDGGGVIEIIALGDISFNSSTPVYVPMANAKAFISSEYGVFESQTDNNGILKLENLSSAVYNINIKMPHPENPSILLTGNIINIDISSMKPHKDTLYATQIAGTGIAINEMYTTGSANSIYYFFDQYLELYNYSDETMYLDGMVVCRFSRDGYSKGPGSDDGDDNDIDGLGFASKFPGNPGEKNYPFEPHTFMVLAVQAINHKNNVPSSVDLSAVDWEFYNQHSTTDFDNPNVPNILNLLPEETNDFYFNMAGDVIILSSGTDLALNDGLDITSIIDGVQYRVDPSFPLSLDSRVDKSTIVTAPKYAGKSMQRREPGMDTNSGRLDWMTIDAPTPGRQ